MYSPDSAQLNLGITLELHYTHKSVPLGQYIGSQVDSGVEGQFKDFAKNDAREEPAARLTRPFQSSSSTDRCRHLFGDKLVVENCYFVAALQDKKIGHSSRWLQLSGLTGDH